MSDLDALAVNTFTRKDKIPWWEDIDAQVSAELELPPAKTLARSAVDVLVVGGGIAGLSAALSAREVGAQVLLLEKADGLGRGATGRNAGILSAGINMGLADLPVDGAEAAFWPETTRLLLNLVQEAKQPGAILYAHLTGAFSLAKTAHAAKSLEREARSRVMAGLQAELWTPAQVKEKTQGRLNTREVRNALWLPDEGRIQPLTLLAHLARRARQQGIEMVGQAEVTDYQEQRSESGRDEWRIALENGMNVRAEGLIWAVGPTAQPDARIYALAFRANLPEDFPLFWDASPYTYADFRPGNGRLTVSGGRYGKAGMTRRDTHYYKRLADAARTWLPELEGQEPRHTWAVDLQVAADMVPELRSLGKRAPGFAIEGLGALGVLPGMVLGQRAGKMVR